MQRINTFKLYELSTHLRALSSATDSTETNKFIFPIYSARNALQELIDHSFVPIHITQKIARDLLDLLNTVWGNVFYDVEKNQFRQLQDGQTIGYWAYAIRDKIQIFENVFSEELQTLSTYIVKVKSIYSTQMLIENADLAFPETLRGFIPEAAKADFKLAGRSLAFELYDAVGFHVFRAVEICLREYYNKYTGSLAKNKIRNWGNYINNLRKVENTIFGAHPSQKTIDYIHYLKEFHRNPLIHPDTNLTPDEAIIVFDSGKTAINAMANEIKDYELKLSFNKVVLPFSPKSEAV